MHHFPGLDEEKILWGVSYQNLNMYLATIPTYDSEEDEGAQPKSAKPDAQLKQIKDFFKNT